MFGQWVIYNMIMCDWIISFTKKLYNNYYQICCSAFTSASGDGVSATTGETPVHLSASAVVGPIAAVCIWNTVCRM